MTAEVEQGQTTENFQLGPTTEKRPLPPSVYAKMTTEAIGNMEPGKEFLSPALARGVIVDLDTSSTWEDLERPGYYGPTAVANLFRTIQAEIMETIDQGPKTTAQEIKKVDRNVSQLATNEALLRAKIRAMRGADGDEIAQMAVVLEQTQNQLREARTNLSTRREKLSLMAEDEKTLDHDENAVTERLGRKVAQLEKLARACIGSKTFGEHLFVFIRKMSDLDEIVKIFTDPNIEKLSATRMEALTGLPGLKPAVDLAFQTLLELDVGMGIDHGEKEPPLPGHKKNICATKDVTPKKRDAFKRALEKKVKNHLEGNGVENPTFFARRGVELAFALHEIFMVSAFFAKTRKRDTLEIIGDRENYKGAPGSMYGLQSNDFADKIGDTAHQLKQEALNGYPTPLTLALIGLPDFFFFDMLHALEIEDPGVEQNSKDEKKISVFDALLDGKIGVSEMFASLDEGGHTSALYQVFRGIQAWQMLAKIPLEKIEMQRGGLDVAYKAIREFASWLPSAKKILEKGYANTLSEKTKQAEVNRILINLTIAFWQRATSITVENGGDRANTEADILGTIKKFVLNYLEEKIVHDTNALTEQQFLFLRHILASNPETAVTIFPEDLTDLDLLNILSEKPSDPSLKTIRKTILTAEKDPQRKISIEAATKKTK